MSHDQAVLVVKVGKAESIFRHIIEEFLLSLEVVLDSLMVIQVVAREVGEDAADKLQPADALLRNGVGTDFHKCVFATGIGHFALQAVEGDRIRGGMFGRYGPVVDVVAYGGN